MRRATITVPDDIDQALQSYLASSDPSPTLAAVVQSALRAFLAERGYLPDVRPLRLTPAEYGSGRADVSAEHDRAFAEE